ncbi:MAG: sodium:calcium antiporter [Candidatus Aminicenantes bacterium]|nr:sodium:calcium antiporter [Candidatus Aminicenantes bacterium]
MLLTWTKFVILLILVYIFGTRATKSADIIAEKKKLARVFMGVVFISMITSFPELFTGISAAAIVKSADLAVGEIIGSCVFNLLIIALIEGVFRKKKLYIHQKKGDIMPLGFSFIMVSLLTLFLSLNFSVTIFNVGIFSLMIFVFYIVFLRILFKERKITIEIELYKNKSLKPEIINFIISGLVIIGIGIYLPVVGKEIAEVMNWSESFVGVIFLAFVTSFPELVVSISTVRIGAFDMFLGNIAGSNLFNIAIIFLIDIFYLKGDVLLDLSPVNMTCGIIAMMMNFIVIFALVRKSSYKVFNLISINALLLVMLYMLNLIILI